MAISMIATCKRCLQQIELVVGSLHWLHVESGRTVCGVNLEATPIKGSVVEEE